MSSLKKGDPCIKHRCIECCIETKMILTQEDIIRLNKAGFKTREFVIRRNGLNYLKNIKGRCFFLVDSGCKIYGIRPEGCRLYPLIFDIANKVALLDPLCPYTEEYTVEEEDVKKLKEVLSLCMGNSTERRLQTRDIKDN